MKQMEKFHQSTSNAEPHKNLIDFLKENKISGKAIDLGCGSGRDTIKLLKNNWKVIGIDSENTEDLIKKRLNQNEIANFKFIQSKFENVKLEKNDLTIAFYSLPFCNKNEFGRVWHDIKDNINKSRIFYRKFLWRK